MGDRKWHEWKEKYPESKKLQTAKNIVFKNDKNISRICEEILLKLQPRHQTWTVYGGRAYRNTRK